MKPVALSLAIASALALSLLTSSAEEKKLDASKLPAASDKKGVTYDKDIKVIFEKSCFKCHGPEKQKSKLRLDSLDAVIKGGENGPDIVPSKIDKSPLIFAVAHVGEDDEEFMPPAKSKDTPVLTKEQVGLIRAWVDQGAK
jgi:mono/diheme cytochrome c family protein